MNIASCGSVVVDKTAKNASLGSPQRLANAKFVLLDQDGNQVGTEQTTDALG